METTTQIYLELTFENGAIKGESPAGGYEKRIDVDSFSFNASAEKQSLQDVDGKTVRNNLEFDRVSISKVFDRASLQLAAAMNGRKKFTEAKLAVDQQYVDPDWEGKVRNEILILYLYDGYIADIKFRTSEGNVGAQIKEDIELSFQNFRVVYYAEDRNKKGLIVDDYRTEAHIYETSREVQQA
jgi:type VI protein secretion system component Hcp